VEPSGEGRLAGAGLPEEKNGREAGFQPTIGEDWLILSFAAPVIGGAVLSGGHVSVAGTVLGVLVVAILTQAMRGLDEVVPPGTHEISVCIKALNRSGTAVKKIKFAFRIQGDGGACPQTVSLR
jgi:hypothetical protein